MSVLRRRSNITVIERGKTVALKPKIAELNFITACINFTTAIIIIIAVIIFVFGKG